MLHPSPRGHTSDSAIAPRVLLPGEEPLDVGDEGGSEGRGRREKTGERERSLHDPPARLDAIALHTAVS
jgi:hypothetical protein